MLTNNETKAGKPKLLSVNETCDLLGLSDTTVRAMCQAKRIRHERHGLGRGVIRIPEDAIDEYRQGVTVPAVPRPG